MDDPCCCDDCPECGLRHLGVQNLGICPSRALPFEDESTATYILELVGERQSVIARKGPNLPACCRRLANLQRHEAHNNRNKHEDGPGFALRGVVEDGDEWRLYAVAEYFIQISGAENDCHAGHEAHRSID